MTNHVHSWEIVGEEDATGRQIVKCVTCQVYDWLDCVQLREKGLPADDPPAEFAARPGAADPTSEALRDAALLLDRIIKTAEKHPSLARELRMYMYESIQEMEVIAAKCMHAWGKRSFANRIVKGD